MSSESTRPPCGEEESFTESDSIKPYTSPSKLHGFHLPSFQIAIPIYP